MSVTDLLSIGASGAQAYRAAMGAVSENISNTTTTGYNRRTVQLGESKSSAVNSLIYKPGVAFGGVNVIAVVRQTDDYLDLAARNSLGTFKDADKRATWQGNVQDALDDSALGVGTQMTSMFSSIEKLAANPTDATLRTQALFAIEQVNTAFKTTVNNVATVQDGITSDASNETVALNDGLKRLASANEALRRATPGSSNAAQIMDERDQALSDISERLNVTVTFGDKGTADVTYDGIKLVDNIASKTVVMTSNTDKSFTLSVDGTDIATPTSGSLSGLSQSATNARDKLQAVNDLATQYVTDMNTWHKAGTTDAGVAGGDILSMSGDASTISIAISDISDIAAADSSGTNGNLVNISSIRGTNGVENGWNKIIAAQANLVSATKAEQAASSTRNDQAQNARADVSGVDLDREAADLMRLQQAYSGCARVIQVGKDTIDAILQIA